MAFSHPSQLHAAFAEALQARDIPALIDLYEAGAVQLQQDGTSLVGYESLSGVFARLLRSGLELDGQPAEAVVAGDIALTSTRYQLSTDAADGTHSTIQVVTAEVSRRQADGSWRVVIDAPTFAANSSAAISVTPMETAHSAG